MAGAPTGLQAGKHKKQPSDQRAVFLWKGTPSAHLVRLIGIEPTHPAPEAGALSTELQAHKNIAKISITHFSQNAKQFLEKTKKVFRKRD